MSGNNHNPDDTNNQVGGTANDNDNEELAPDKALPEGPQAGGNVAANAPPAVRFSFSDPEVSGTPFIDGNYEGEYWHDHQTIHGFLVQLIVDGQAMQAVGAALAGGGADAAATATAIADAADLCPNGLESYVSPQVFQGLAQARAAIRAAVMEGQAQGHGVYKIALASMARSASSTLRAMAIGYVHKNTIDE